MLGQIQALKPGEALPKLPDIDGALMVLMGLGQGAYLGKKLTTTLQARLSGLSAGSGKPGDEIKLSGSSFGDQQNGSLITIDNAPFQANIPASDWSDTLIKFKIPEKQLNGEDWPKEGRVIRFGLIVAGQESVNQLPFTVTPKTQ